MKLLYTKQQIKEACQVLAQRLNEDYKDKELIIVVVLNGGFKFAMELIQGLTLDYRLEFIKAKSYIDTESKGTVDLSMLPTVNLRNKHVLLVDDILDTGLTMNRLLEYFGNSKSVEACVLLNKSVNRKLDISPKYFGLTTSDFVIGFGLDYNLKYRDLPDIYIYEDTDGTPESNWRNLLYWIRG